VSQPPPGRPPNPRLPAVQPAVPRQSWSAFARHKLMSHVDRRIAAVSHLSIAFGILIGVGFMLGIVINLVIWLRSKRSPFVELHAEQAGAYQLTVFILNIVIVSVWIAGLVMLMGGSEIGVGQISLRQIVAGLWCALVPLFAVWFFGTILYGVYGGIVIAAGGDFSYPIFGPWARRRMAAKGKTIDH
jgi:uncharacterized Tic20 family protein